MLDLPEIKPLADDKLNVVEMMINVSEGVENLAGKGENGGSQHFLIIQQFSSQRVSSQTDDSTLSYTILTFNDPVTYM